MITFEPTPQACAAAARATVLAGIARRRTLLASARDGQSLFIIAELLDIAALSFYEEELNAADGNQADAWLALTEAETTALDAPGAGFPPGFGQYVTHALGHGPLQTLASLADTDHSLAGEDTRLTAALDELHAHLDAAATEEVAQALLEAVFALHHKRAALAQLAWG